MQLKSAFLVLVNWSNSMLKLLPLFSRPCPAVDDASCCSCWLTAGESHRMSMSADMEMSLLDSGTKATSTTLRACRLLEPRNSPVSASHRRTVASSEPEQIVLDEEKTREYIA